MRTFIFTFICFLIVSIGKAEEARLIRFPHINGKQIVFSYAGDLYTVSDQGGTARKLTSDIGYEMFPRISPDGKYIAFTGQYDGNTEVFVIPSAGGIPRRLTYTATLNRDDLGPSGRINNPGSGLRNKSDAGEYRQQSKFTISSAEQARKIVDALLSWIEK